MFINLQGLRAAMPKAVNVNESIQFVGLHDLLPEEQEEANRLATQAYLKIKRDLQESTSLIVHIKRYKKTAGEDEKRQKYSVHVKVIAATRMPLVSSMAHDWELPRAIHKAFDDIKAQLIHHFHTDVTRPDM
jgi:hypothetical protein